MFQPAADERRGEQAAKQISAGCIGQQMSEPDPFRLRCFYAMPIFGRAPCCLIPVNMLPRPGAILLKRGGTRRREMRCVVTLKDGDAMERAMGALAKYRYTARGEPVAPEGHPREWKSWRLEIDSTELQAIRDHVDAGDIVDMKPVNDPASSELH